MNFDLEVNCKANGSHDIICGKCKVVLMTVNPMTRKSLEENLK